MIKYGKKLTGAEDRLPLLAEKLSEREDIMAIYLFGSRALKIADDMSDIDIAILLRDGKLSFDEELYLLNEINSILGTDEVSLVILNKAPLGVRNGVIKESKVLYSADDNARLMFEEKVMKQYMDFKYYLDAYDKEFMASMKYGKVS
jgi:predicted nucleotidyltransferase